MMVKRQTSWNVDDKVSSKPAAATPMPAPVAETDGEKEVLIGAMLPVKARTALKRLGADHGKNQKQLLMEAIDKLLVSYGVDPLFK